jgi:hypothetical protein
MRNRKSCYNVEIAIGGIRQAVVIVIPAITPGLKLSSLDWLILVESDGVESESSGEQGTGTCDPSLGSPSSSSSLKI